MGGVWSGMVVGQGKGFGESGGVVEWGRCLDGVVVGLGMGFGESGCSSYAWFCGSWYLVRSSGALFLVQLVRDRYFDLFFRFMFVF